MEGTPVSCNILVKRGRRDLGYISPTWNQYGEYGALQPSAIDSLEIEFTYDSSSPDRLTGVVKNGPNDYFPILGAVMGFSTDGVDMSEGSINYAYIVGITKTQPSPSTPFNTNSFSNRTKFDMPIQTSIWQYDTATGALSAQWINADSSAPKTYALYAEDEQTLFITGDPAAFSNATDTAYPEV
ncbi:hypothetical protein FRC07_005119, partial [Ceratobasidium sp. 392]